MVTTIFHCDSMVSVLVQRRVHPRLQQRQIVLVLGTNHASMQLARIVSGFLDQITFMQLVCDASLYYQRPISELKEFE